MRSQRLAYSSPDLPSPSSTSLISSRNIYYIQNVRQTFYQQNLQLATDSESTTDSDSNQFVQEYLDHLFSMQNNAQLPQTSTNTQNILSYGDSQRYMLPGQSQNQSNSFRASMYDQNAKKDSRDEKIDKISQRLTVLEERFTVMDAKLEQMDTKIEQMEIRMEKRMDERFNEMEERFDKKLENLQANIMSKIDIKLNQFMDKVLSIINGNKNVENKVQNFENSMVYVGMSSKKILKPVVDVEVDQSIRFSYSQRSIVSIDVPGGKFSEKEIYSDVEMKSKFNKKNISKQEKQKMDKFYQFCEKWISPAKKKQAHVTARFLRRQGYSYREILKVLNFVIFLKIDKNVSWQVDFEIIPLIQTFFFEGARILYDPQVPIQKEQVLKDYYQEFIKEDHLDLEVCLKIVAKYFKIPNLNPNLYQQFLIMMIVNIHSSSILMNKQSILVAIILQSLKQQKRIQEYEKFLSLMVENEKERYDFMHISMTNIYVTDNQLFKK